VKRKKCAAFLCDKDADALGDGDLCYAHAIGLQRHRRKYPVRTVAPTGRIIDVVDGALVIEKLLKPTDGRLLKNRRKNKQPRYGRKK
jgi:hypothetical protein